ncbi:MAG: ATP-binding protein [Anaerolineae bacterium]
MNDKATTMQHGAHLNADELRTQLTSTYALVLALAGGVAWFYFVAAPTLRWWHTVGSIALCLQGATAYLLNRRDGLPARLVLLLGPPLALALMVWRTGDLVPAYVALLIAVACFAIQPTAGLLSAAESTFLLLGVAPDRRLLVLPLAMLWAAVGLLFVGERGRLTVLEWAWQSQQQALRLLERLREQQGRLNRALRAMDEANARLATMNLRLAEAKQSADEARAAKARFAASVSHELRTPLNVIVGFAEVMYSTPQAYRGTMLSPAFLMDLGAVYRNAQHLQKLVDDVLDLAQLEAGKFVLQMAPTEIGPLVQEALDTVANMGAARGLALRSELAANLPAVRIDRTRIKQVLLNLLSNALRYTEQGEVVVSVALNENGSQLVCAVHDTGPGIDEEQQHSLFEEFEKPAFETTQPGRGSGLGLAISKRLVQEHGGRIWVQSRRGEGSTFAFSLPVRDQDGYHGLQTPLPMVTDAGTSELAPVLLVTPSLLAARLFTRRLEGYRCLVTTDRQQALQQIADLQPRGVIVDAALGEDVEDSIGRAIADHTVASVPLVVCPMPVESRLGASANVRGYLSKPVTRPALQDTLRNLGEDVHTVLVVDDQEDVLRLFVHYLEDDVSRPYQVLTARNGRQALEIMLEAHPDLVMLDLVMPQMDGYEVLRAMSADERLAQVPVVVVSGQVGGDERAAFQGWVKFTLPKGASAGRVAAGLSRLLTGLQGEAE